MATLAVMKARIADELARTDLTSQIALAIQSAIDFYEQLGARQMNDWVLFRLSEDRIKMLALE